MDSHEFAAELEKAAQILKQAPAFAIEHDPVIGLYFWCRKEAFLNAVKLLGPGTKEYSGTDLRFRPRRAEHLFLQINRDAVCRKVQEEKWECEPLLSPAEEQSVGV